MVRSEKKREEKDGRTGEKKDREEKKKEKKEREEVRRENGSLSLKSLGGGVVLAVVCVCILYFVCVYCDTKTEERTVSGTKASLVFFFQTKPMGSKTAIQ